MAVRLGTTSAQTAHARLRRAGAKLHNDEVVHLAGYPPMFFGYAGAERRPHSGP